jgi:hypothetical protein
MTSPPAIYAGTAVLRFAYNAMIGPCSYYVNVRSELVLEIANENAKNASRESSESISRAAMVGWEDFGSDSVKYAGYYLQFLRQ